MHRPRGAEDRPRPLNSINGYIKRSTSMHLRTRQKGSLDTYPGGFFSSESIEFWNENSTTGHPDNSSRSPLGCLFRST